MDRRAFLQSPVSSPPRAKAAASIPKPAPLSISAGLEPYTTSLDRRHLDHLLRRVGFGVSLEERLHTFVGQTAAEVVDHLLAKALTLPLPPPPFWVDRAPPGPGASESDLMTYRTTNRTRLTAWQRQWLRALRTDGLREKMTAFWHNHFVTEFEVYELAPYAYRYLTMLRTHALGNFKDFVRLAGLDPAMLIYLNGNVNVAGAPNENYGRELLELFTMGPRDGHGTENYTQTDIVEVARALTGWTVINEELSVAFDEALHDDGDKTILGRTGQWGYDDVIDILFEERADKIAEFIARKLYREFVFTVPDEGIVAGLTQVFLDNDFEIAPVMRALLTSAHFFDDLIIGAKIKSPLDLLVGILCELDLDPINVHYDKIIDFAEEAEQKILSPPNVAGWPGHRDWITTKTMASRTLNAERFFFGLWTRNLGSILLDFVEKMHPPGDPMTAFRLPIVLAQHLMPVPIESLNIYPPTDEFAGDLITYPVPQEILDGPAHELDLIKLFLIDVPWYEWHTFREGAGRVVAQYIQTLIKYPEFQLT